MKIQKKNKMLISRIFGILTMFKMKIFQMMKRIKKILSFMHWIIQNKFIKVFNKSKNMIKILIIKIKLKV